MDTKIFFGKDSGAVYDRADAHGYKKLKIDENVVMGTPIKMITGEDGETLVVTQDEIINKDEAETMFYTFICKEFGVYGYKDNSSDSLYADISVIFLDNGYMLVTLFEGTLMLNFEDRLVQPMVNFDSCPEADVNRIYWVNAERLLSLQSGFGNKYHNRYLQDFEYFFTVKGSVNGGLTNLSVKPYRDRHIDLSLGYVAMVEERERKRAEAKQACKNMDMFLQSAQSETSLDIDDDDDMYDEEDDPYAVYEEE